MTEKTIEVLDLLIQHELAIKQLYEVFSGNFAGQRDLWQRLAGDEQKHADLLGTLRSEALLENWLLRESRVRPQGIKASIGYVEGQIAKARESKFTLLQALAIARDLESALLEKEIEKLGESHSEEIRSVIKVLAEETAGHRNALITAIGVESRSAARS